MLFAKYTAASKVQPELNEARRVKKAELSVGAIG